MSWRDQMGPASFRGVPFFLDSAEFSGGRRIVKHEYPFRADPFAEDMGRRAREFPVEGFVLGDDYIAARDALITALEVSGPGELVHPYFGTRRVVVLDFRVRESASTGGAAQFSISFGETPAAATQPTAATDASGALRASVSAARSSAGAEFVARYSPGAKLNSLSGALGAMSDQIDAALNTVRLAAQIRADLVRKVLSIRDGAVELVSAPADLLSDLSDLFAAFDVNAVTALLSVYGFNPGLRPPATTSNRVREQQNFDALRFLIQRLALIRAVELALEQTFDSYDAAVAARAVLTDLIDDQADTAADDTYPALLQMRADLTKAVPGEDGDLPKLVNLTPAATVPSLVLTYQLYGDVEKEADLIARNRIRNPTTVVGGRGLEVLSRD